MPWGCERPPAPWVCVTLCPLSAAPWCEGGPNAPTAPADALPPPLVEVTRCVSGQAAPLAVDLGGLVGRGLFAKVAGLVVRELLG